MNIVSKLLLCFVFVSVNLSEYAHAQLRFSHRDNPVVKELQKLYDDRYDEELFSVTSSVAKLSIKDANDVLVWAAFDLHPGFKIEFYNGLRKNIPSLIDDFIKINPSNDEEIFRLNAVKYALAMSNKNYAEVASVTKTLKGLYDKGWKPLYNMISVGMYFDYVYDYKAVGINELVDFVVLNASRSNLYDEQFLVLNQILGRRDGLDPTTSDREKRYMEKVIERMVEKRLDLFPEFLNSLWRGAHNSGDLFKTRKEYVDDLNGVLSKVKASHSNASALIEEASILYRIFHLVSANQVVLVNELIKINGSKEAALQKIIKYFNTLHYDGAVELLANPNITWDKPFKDLILKLKNQDQYIVYRYSNYLNEYLTANDVSDDMVGAIMIRIINNSMENMVDNSDMVEFDAAYLNPRLSSAVDKMAMIRSIPKYKNSSELTVVAIAADLNYHFNYLITNNAPAPNIDSLEATIAGLNAAQVDRTYRLLEIYLEQFTGFQDENKGKLTAQMHASLKKLTDTIKTKLK